MRRSLKDLRSPVDAVTTEAYRNRIKAVELEAERLQQETLYALAGTLPRETAPSSTLAAQRNIAAYRTVAGREFPATAIDVLLQALGHVDAGAFADGAAPGPAR